MYPSFYRKQLQTVREQITVCKQTKSLHRPIPARKSPPDAPKQAEYPKRCGTYMLPNLLSLPCSSLCISAGLLIHTHCLHTQAALYFHRELKSAAAPYLQRHTLKLSIAQAYHTAARDSTHEILSPAYTLQPASASSVL